MASKGKWAEAEVKKVLSDLEREVVGFVGERIPDAHGGFMQPAAADFQWFKDMDAKIMDLSGFAMTGSAPYTRNGLLEVKEVEHLSRLPHKNFGVDKIARMWKRKLAGCETDVLVAHKLKGMRKPQVTWRAVPLEFFRNTVYEKGVGSWDLSPFPLVHMETYMRRMVLEADRG